MPQSNRRPEAALRPVVHAVCLALAGMGAAQAQTPDTAAATPQKVEITGSMIKRIDGEGALPVQTITAGEIKKLGVTTASELMAKISANSNSLTDGASVGVGGDRDQKGFNSANLRGIGTSSTLVLLNGRRMANFASPGDDAGVDLNNIPAAALERVEILLDGASALYGTDAISGVINFITRSDYRGAEVFVYGGDTQEGGAGKTQLTLSGGFGDLAKDGFNVFGTFDYQKTKALRTSQRDFIDDLKIPERLPHLLSSYTSPANIDISDEQLEFLRARNFRINGKLIDSTLINVGAPECDPPASLHLPAGIGGEFGCTYDYMRDVELFPESDKYNFLGRGALQLPGGHQLYGEVALSRSTTRYAGTAARPGIWVNANLVPEFAALGMGDDGVLEDPEVRLRTRLFEAGMRTSELTSESQRYVVGITGMAGGWDYDVGVNHSVSKVDDKDVNGYLLYDRLEAAIQDGTVNVLGRPNAGDADFYKSITVNQVVRSSKGTMDSVDGHMSRALTRLEGGDLSLGVGAEFRHEKQRYTPSELLLSDNIEGDRYYTSTASTNDSRNVSAVFAELDVPFTKQWSAQLGLRYDHYQGIGGTTNPKIGLLYQPMPELKLRGSAGTGFRAPSLTELNRPTRYSTSSILPDPVCMAENDNDLATCADSWGMLNYSNPDLKPEKSRQFTLGFVAQPTRNLSFSVDYWNIKRTDVIGTLGEDIILSNLDKYGHLVHRYSDPRNGNADFIEECGEEVDPDDHDICYLEMRRGNFGSANTSGLDIAAAWGGLATPVGMFGVRLNGTYTLKSEQQTGPGDPFVSNLGRFVTDGVVQRWRHQLSFDWERGPVGLTLSNTYYSGYEDQNSAIDTETGTVVAEHHVKAYSLWDLSGFWNVDGALTLRAGVRNLLDTPPPFSNQAYYFISGYDPSYTDPRGRFFYASLQYQFK